MADQAAFGSTVVYAGGCLWHVLHGYGRGLFCAESIPISDDCVCDRVCHREPVCRDLIGEFSGKWFSIIALSHAYPMANGGVADDRESGKLVSDGGRTGVTVDTAMDPLWVCGVVCGGNDSIYAMVGPIGQIGHIRQMIKPGSMLWQYLTPEQRVLAGDGEFLMVDAARHRDQEPTDYSYVVFPFAKLYEGFLKHLFHDVGIITEREFRGDKFRIGKTLSPHLVSRLRGRSAYGQIVSRHGKDVAERLWHTWKVGRNQVFHYFPDNYRALTLEQARGLITDIVDTMEMAVEKLRVRKGQETGDMRQGKSKTWSELEKHTIAWGKGSPVL